MNSASRSRFALKLIALIPLLLLARAAFAGTVTIASPRPGSTSGAVSISASAQEPTPFHLELWDNGSKLGDFFSNSVNASPAMSQGAHILTVLAVSPAGKVLDQSSVPYTITGQASARGTVTIASPAPGATSISAVTIAASANESTPFHLEVWDNGYKLGDVPAGNINAVYVLPNGSHVLTIQSIDNNTRAILSKSSVAYKVAENCVNSRYAECNLDQIGVDNTQNDCNPKLETTWVANPCGPGVQGVNPVFPLSTLVQAVTEGSAPPAQGNLTLNGHSLHVQEVQGRSPSNVIFRSQSPNPAPANSVDTHWTLDQYVHLPDPAAHQAFEIDAQYTGGGIWSKFYTECAFNLRSGTGFWGVFDSTTGGWIFLNGQPQGGQTPPVVPCNRSQFYQPWSGSSNPAFTGWHHIVWNFLRNPDGTVTYQSLIFDGASTPINFHPNSASGGQVGDKGNFGALIQLDGVVNTDGHHDVVDAYVSEVNLTHMP